MAYIQPQTNVKLLHRVPLDKEHRNTWLFASRDAQYAKFAGYSKYSYLNFSYQRANENAINVEAPADDLYDVNYMMFQNKSFGNKWFYAFVDSVEYVNDNCTRVHYHIDNLMTYWFDVECGECFIEREHVSDDEVGHNLIPEPLEVGEFTTQDVQAFNPSTEPTAGAGVLVYYSPKTPAGQIYNNIYAAYRVWAYQLQGNNDIDAQAIDEKINTLIAESNVIVGVVAVPRYMAKANADGTLYRGLYQRDFEIFANWTFPKKDGTAYTPKNNKLFNPQFCKIVVESPNGDKQEYTRTGFTEGESSVFHFRIVSTAWPMPEQRCYAKFYESVLETDPARYTRYTDFPALSWAEDSATTWWAQNGTSFLLSAVANIGLTAAGAVTANPLLVAGGVAGLAGNAGQAATASQQATEVNGAGMNGGLSTTAPQQQEKQQPRPTGADVVKQAIASMSTLATVNAKPAIVRNGSNTGGLINVGGGFGYFFLYQQGIYGEYAERIDHFLTMFGYQVNEVKKPNVKGGGTVRPRWNYVKTNGANVFPAANSGAPADAVTDIAAIFDNGVTFWSDSATVGDYSATNKN